MLAIFPENRETLAETQQDMDMCAIEWRGLRKGDLHTLKVCLCLK